MGVVQEDVVMCTTKPLENTRDTALRGVGGGQTKQLIVCI